MPYQFFETNLPLVYFLYSLVFFLMGFGILLKNRSHSRYYMADSLKYLALFGITHGMSDWGNFFIPIQKSYLDSHFISFLESLQLILNATSFFFLFFFGIHLLVQTFHWNSKINYLPFIILGFWFVNFMMLKPILVNEHNEAWWFAISDIWARYLLAFPGGIVSSIALYIQYKQFTLFGASSMVRTLYCAVITMGIYALTAGFIVPYAPMLPTFLFSSDLFFTTTGFPIEVFRGLSGFFMAFFIIKILKVFDIEYQNVLYQAEKEKAVMEERNRIARDLHDGMIQSIYATGLHLDGIRHKMSGSNDDSVRRADQNLEEAIGRLNRMIREIRGFIRELKMPGDQQPDLKAEIEKLIREMNTDAGLRIHQFYELKEDTISLAQSIQILFIVKEALSNIIRHAGAKEVIISATRSRSALIVKIADNGKGVENLKRILASRRTGGFKQGIHNMQYRAKSIGGKLSVKSDRDKGTIITLKIREERKKMVNKIRLFLVDDHELVRLGLKSLLSFYSHIEIVGESGNTEDALAAILSSKPDIVLLDIKMPGKNGIQACREMNEADPSIQVIMLTSFDDDESIYESIMAGAKGYILKEIGSRELVQAIETVAQGNSMLDPAVTARVLHKIKHPSTSESKWERLTSQEKEVLNLISKGMTNRQIARNILLGEKTVRNYVSVIFSKLEVSNRAEAAVYTVRHHLDKE